MSLALPAAIRLLLPDGAVKNILLEDYLRGVVAAALDADAPLEAQKALAVAARTFAAHTHRHLEQGAALSARTKTNSSRRFILNTATARRAARKASWSTRPRI